METALTSSVDDVIKSENKISDLEKRIELLTSDILPYYNSIFKELCNANAQNAEILCDFIMTEYNNQNIKTNTKLTHIKIICWFSKYSNYKDFQLITRHNIIDYLNSLRKIESIDPTHKWIGTYNIRQMILSKFFRI